MGLIVSRAPVIRQRQQRDQVNPAAHQSRRARQHLLGIAAFVEVADQDQVGLAWLADQPLAIGQCRIDIGPPAQLDTSKNPLFWADASARALIAVLSE